MTIKDMKWSVLAFGLLLWHVSADEYNVNMENTEVCTMSGTVLVKSQDIYNIFAQPLMNGQGTRTRCNVRFIADGGKKFKLYVRDLVFRECQVKIKMFEGSEANTLNNARYTFDCNSGTGKTYVSYYNDIVISLQKPDSESKGYKFYMRLALEDGPDISGGADGPFIDKDETLSGGMIAGIVVGIILVIVIIVALTVFGIITYRRKQEEKAALAHSMTTLVKTGTERGGSSVHSSMHDSVHSSKHSMYPAFRSTISEKNPKCESIDTKSYDSDAVDGIGKPKPPIKSVKHEFDSMRRGLQREKYRQAREEEESRNEEARWREAQRIDKQSRAESNRGLGRSNRNRREDRLLLTNENLKNSLRQARSTGRSFDDRSSRKGSTRSHRSRQKSHSPSRSAGSHRGYRTDSDYNYSDNYDDDYHRDRSRNRTRSHSGRSQRSSSAGTSRRNRDYVRDDYSDYDDRHKRHRHDSPERYSEDEFRGRRDSSGHRSGHQRSRSQSASRRRR